MKVYELGDSLTNLSHSGFAQEEIVVVIDGKEYEITSAVNVDGEMKLFTGDVINSGNELM